MKNTVKRYSMVLLLGLGMNMSMVRASFAVNPLRDKDNPLVPRASALVLPRYSRTGTDAFPSASYYNTRVGQANSRANRWGGCTFYHEYYGVPRCQH